MLLFLTNKTFFASILVGVVAVAGDFIESKQTSPFWLAVVDNFTHFLVAILTWWTVALSKTTFKNDNFRDIILCGLLASLVDVDHFLKARSWRLQEASKLDGRAFLHNTSLILILAVLLLIWSRWFSLPLIWTLGWIVIAAGVSHHIRDATRRGFWLWPFGSTPPTPYYLYIFMQMMFPIFLSKLYNSFGVSQVYSYSNVHLV